MVRLAPLTRLRISFLALGVALLAPLGFLLHSVNQRLDAQRRLRHEVVSERIFDELERELGDLLAEEAARPSAAYDARDTRSESWAPFVIGYFKTRGGAPTLLAADQLEPARRQQLLQAIARWEQRSGRAAPESVSALDAQEDNKQKKPAPRSSPEILRQLNRAEAPRWSSPKKSNDQFEYQR